MIQVFSPLKYHLTFQRGMIISGYYFPKERYIQFHLQF